jgi:predicted NUDIX family NTP pyrophosphohydrolase
MAKISAGLLMYRMRNEKIEVLLVHPGKSAVSRPKLLITRGSLASSAVAGC